MNEMELDALGYKKVYAYTDYANENHVNVIPEESFKRLVSDTFKVIADVLRETYGPYGSTIMISDQSETTTTKDGYNIYNAIGFSHQYKRLVYIAIKKIIERVNRRVGDGTTTCILLAEKIFNHLIPLLDTADHKRELDRLLNFIEDELNRSEAIDEDRKRGYIHPLTKSNLYSLLMVASNYDKELVESLVEAFDAIDDGNVITDMRNVIVDTSTTYESSSKTSYQIDYLPGDYRCRVDMETEVALAFDQPQQVKVLLYDHTFGKSDWNGFTASYDNETPVMIIARSFSIDFMNNDFVRYCARRGSVKMPVYVHLVQMKGDYVQDELKDLGAILNTNVRDVHTLAVDWDSLETYTISVFKYNCLCVHNVTAPETYIRDLTIEMEQEKSFVHKTLLKNRIKALSLKQKDTIVTVKAATSLELKMISDKIDDCVCIAQSAFEYGIVPNLLYYADERMDQIHDSIVSITVGEDGKFAQSVVSEIQLAIEELFKDIWNSKYKGYDENEIPDAYPAMAEFFGQDYSGLSYDILEDDFVPCDKLPTSAQYDIEVLIASLSIVKYLLTSRAFIFDSFLMTPQGDQGHFQRVDD
jgi:chaperonin GroEL (HSP60 family)